MVTYSRFYINTVIAIMPFLTAALPHQALSLTLAFFNITSGT